MTNHKQNFNLKRISLLSLVVILVNLCISIEVHAQSISNKTRVIICTDMSNEPDDQQSLVRALLYSNELDIEGILATTSCFKRSSPDIQAIRRVIDAYDKVHPNLLLHSADYPSAAYLRSISKSGVDGYGMSAATMNLNNEGIDLIISVIDKDDPRPVWILSWGGSNNLGGAVMKVKNTRTEAEVEKFISKIRGYEIAIQDDGQAYIMHNFPDAKLIASILQFKGMSKTTPSFNAWPESWGGNNDILNASWVSLNIQTNHGALGQEYLNADFLFEGDSPSFLYLIPNGLGSPEHPEYGSWGGRFNTSRSLNPRTGTGNYTVDPKLDAYKDYSMFTEANDTWAYDNGTKITTYTNNQYAPVFRWREAYQYDMQARMDWCVNPYNQANHPPVAVFDGELEQTVEPDATVNLSAARSSDPDGNTLTYNWAYYKEAGTCTENLNITNTTNSNASFIVPQTSSDVTIHIILSVTDNGSPALTRYKRIIYRVQKQIPSGLHQLDTTPSFLFSNPVKIGEILKIKSEENSTVKIYDIQGRLLYTNILTNGMIELPNSIHQGIYLVSIESFSNTLTTKLIVN